MPRRSPHSLYLVLRRVLSAIGSFLIVAPLMIIALSVTTTASLKPGVAWAGEHSESQAADDYLPMIADMQARVKALEHEAESFKPEGRPLRAKAGSGAEPMPATKEHVLLGRQVSAYNAHKAAIAKLRARVDAFEKEARGHEMGHQLSGSNDTATRKTTGSASERVNRPNYGSGLRAKSQALERDIAAAEQKARAIYKKPGRLK